ncbi:MAG: hypothetical protein ABJF10_22880 [Chthoniobacter sp.]
MSAPDVEMVCVLAQRARRNERGATTRRDDAACSWRLPFTFHPSSFPHAYRLRLPVRLFRFLGQNPVNDHIQLQVKIHAGR